MKPLLSTGSVPGHGLEDTFRLAHKYSFNGIELIIPDVNWQPNLHRIRIIAERYSQRVFSVHVPFFGKSLLRYLAAPRRFARRSVGTSVQIANELGAENLVIHPFPALVFRDGIRSMMRAVLMECAQRTPARLSLENMEIRRFLGIGWEPYCIADYTELYEFAKQNGLYLTLDTAHCMSKGISPATFFEEFHDRINNVHLSDYGDYQCHLSLGEGIIDFGPFCEVLARYDYRGFLTLEIESANESSLAQSLDLIREYQTRRELTRRELR